MFYPHVKFVTSAAEADQLAPDMGREIAFAGRSNSGKSTAINAITQRAGLARVSRTPGRTQLINFFELAPERGSSTCRATDSQRFRKRCALAGSS